VLKKLKGVVLFLLAAGIGFGIYFLNDALPIGTGYSAKYICSQVFLAGRDPVRVFREDVTPTHPLFRLVTPHVDYDAKTVTADVFGFWKEMTAVYRDGCGCTLAIDSTRKVLLEQAKDIPVQKILRSDLPWPHGSMVDLDRLPENVDREKLDQAVEDAFKEPGPDTMRNTQAIVVVYGDKIIAEHYRDDFNRDTPILGWSMSKSVTSALAGILVRDGKLDIMKPAPVAVWKNQGDPRGAITPDMMLRMSTGLEFQESYAPFKDATYMLYASNSMADFAAAKPLRVEPDQEWYYSSGTTNIVAKIIRDLTGGTLQSFTAFSRERLFNKIQMLSAVIEPDASGSFVGSSYMFATARDWARFGLLVKNDGIWNNERILPEGWVQYVSTPTPTAPIGEYGAHFWLNAGAPGGASNRTFPKLPTDLVYLSGFNSQIVAVIPSRDIVAVRLGVTHDDSWDSEDFLVQILAAVK
jgi:CubicO group peptidase (beta-lactamase class C family)